MRVRRDPCKASVNCTASHMSSSTNEDATSHDAGHVSTTRHTYDHAVLTETFK